MSKDPWRKAYQLSRIKRESEPKPGQPPARVVIRRAFPWGPVVSTAVLVLVLGGGAAAWFTRGWWLPRYKPELPPVVTENIAEPRVTVDYTAVEEGLGIKLCILGDYLDLVAATRDLGFEWELKQLGGEQLRLEAPGLLVYATQGQIWNWKLDLDKVFADQRWAGLQSALRKAGLSPDLTWAALTGEAATPAGVKEQVVRSSAKRQMPQGWAHPNYVLAFTDSWLKRVEGRIEFGETAPEQSESQKRPESGSSAAGG
jgi:hypothetical protein